MPESSRAGGGEGMLLWNCRLPSCSSFAPVRCKRHPELEPEAQDHCPGQARRPLGDVCRRSPGERPGHFAASLSRVETKTREERRQQKMRTLLYWRLFAFLSATMPGAPHRNAQSKRMTTCRTVPCMIAAHARSRTRPPCSRSRNGTSAATRAWALPRTRPRTTFLLRKDGGAIQVTANSADDKDKPEQIQMHLRHIAARSSPATSIFPCSSMTRRRRACP